jgi:hypothetical protein
MDNRGNRIIVASDRDSAINIPAVGAALVVKRYSAQVPDEISLEVNYHVTGDSRNKVFGLLTLILKLQMLTITDHLGVG